MEKMTDLKKFYESYWEYRKKIKHLAIRNMPKRIIMIANLISVKDKIDILDIGCGEGGLGILLKSKYKDRISIFGWDISKTALEMAKKHYDQVKQLDIEEEKNLAKVINKKFDYIVVSEVLEHLVNPDDVLEKLKSLLKKNGHFIVTFPNTAFWKYRLQLLFGHFPSSQ